MTTTLVLRHFLIKSNDPRFFFLRFVFFFNFFASQLFLVSGYVGVGDLMKGTFSFLAGTIFQEPGDGNAGCRCEPQRLAEEKEREVQGV